MEDERCQRRLSFETTFRTEKELGIIKSLDPQMFWHPNFVKYILHLEPTPRQYEFIQIILDNCDQGDTR